MRGDRHLPPTLYTPTSAKDPWQCPRCGEWYWDHIQGRCPRDRARDYVITEILAWATIALIILGACFGKEIGRWLVSQ